MGALVVVGAQWGDVGKGRVTDYLAEEADLVVRYQGGSNAGHTVAVGGEEFKLHLVPSGILYPGKLCVIGNGVALDLEVLREELHDLAARGIDTAGLRLSYTAHLVFPYHHRLDALEEKERGQGRLGTTGRGIGPAYQDKVARRGLRVVDLLDPDPFRERLTARVAEVNRVLAARGAEPLDAAALTEQYLAWGREIKPYLADTSLLVNQALDAGQRVLFEGAQGTLLDLDHGTYPFVTSSHPVAAGACLGAGVGPTRLDHVLGVAKAYSTRVGEGPFPTELQGTLAEHLRQRGREFGTTTGRPRRCGWLDVVALRYAVRINGLSSLALTTLDVLDGLERVYMATAYRVGEDVVREFPASLAGLAAARPVYEELPGWPEGTAAARGFTDLAPQARAYIRRLEELAGVPVSLVAVGPRRDQTIIRQAVF